MSTNSISNLCSTISKNIDTDSGKCNITAEELTNLFVNTDYYNAGQAGAEQLQEQIEDLEKVIAKLVEEADGLNDSINDRQDDINKKSEDLSEVVSSIAGEQIEYQIAVKNAARAAARDAVSAFQKDSSGSYEEYFDEAFNSELNGIAGNMGTIKNLYADYQDIKGDLQGFFDDIAKDTTEIESIQKQLNITNATINLLTITRDNMSSIIESAYENCDTDTEVPIYSGEKATIANGLLAEYTSRYTTEGDTGTSTTDSSNQEAVKSKWATVSSEATCSSSCTDKNNASSNASLANLAQCIEDGMLTELQESGMSVQEIMEFISETWTTTISYDEESGNWDIPWGHGTTAKTAFSAIRSLITDSTSYLTADDVNQTQMTELAEFITDGQLATLYEAGFTFKEAMYLLTQLFPDAGIVYDLDDQDGTRTYSIVSDTDASNGLYETIADLIYKYWGVEAESATETDTSTSGETESHDPITFTIGNVTYTFLSKGALDDGTFDYESGTDNDLMGSTNGISELFEYDYDGNGVIDAEDYTYDEDGNKVYALDQITLLVNTQAESVDESEDIDQTNGNTNSVSFDVSYTSARLAGITSIDLTQYLATDEDGNYIEDDENDDKLYKYSTGLTGSGEDEATSTKTYDNVDEAYEDINGSSVINTFTLTMEGQDEPVTVNETLNTDSNLETFYKQIADNDDTANAFSSIDQEEYEDALDNWSNTDEFRAKEAYDKLTGLSETLTTQKDQIEGLLETYGDDSDFEASYANFIELMGEDGKSGDYINTVRNRAAEKSEAYKNNSDYGADAADAAEEATYEVMEEKFGSDMVEDVKAADE